MGDQTSNNTELDRDCQSKSLVFAQCDIEDILGYMKIIYTVYSTNNVIESS